MDAIIRRRIMMMSTGQPSAGYSVTYSLSHVSSSNSSTTAIGSYSTTLTADINYTIGTVVVTMGGIDITSSAYSNGVVTISTVTGRITISATATSIYPYDSEVEYLESSGSQVINTGIAVSDIRKYETYTQITVKTSAQAEGSTESNKYFFVGQNAQKKLYAALGTTVKATSTTNNGSWHTLILNLTGGTFSIDGTDVAVATGTISSSIKFALFACNGVAATEGNYAYYITGKKGRTKIYGENNTLLADFKPVRVGQVGYMYDSVSGNLFGNVGSGSFSIGQDV